ncbi:hypothetical protein QBC41DRAFT_388518 [Cercophora samala]|uniref:Uncharacterized protein n=1 Tax=Cercophora samala TaxID=330535 RepID=A0AA39ZG57_9PEZI|nr:hypothetical protein QBC41DRAFT_388518 [Cercophora samala]
MGPDARSEPWLREALWQKVEQGIGNYWDPFLDYTIAKLCGLPSTVQSTEIILNELPIKSKTAAESPSLETLASELRLIILQSIPDFDDIMSLIRASPVFLQHYLGEKKSLLAGCLKMSLNTVLVDAMAVQRAATLRGDKSVNRHHIQTHLNMYCLERECGESEIEKLIKNHNEDFLFDIFLFWQTYVRPLAVRFTRLFLFRFDPQRPPIFTQLSPTENTRLLRALYRFELYSYLFGGESRHLQLDYTEEQMLALFFCLFRPWEVEEIFSIYTLVHDEMTTRLRMMEKKMFHNVTREFAFTGGAASWGLRGFDMVLKDTNLYSMTTIRSSSNRWTSGYGFMENILSQRAQERRRSIWPNDDDLAEDRGDPLPYVGESESEPSYGWVLVCKEKYLNAYGGDVKNPSPRDWGYVFWDRWRLTKFNGDKKLKSSSWVPGAAA